jgi:hypothetical protein
MDVDAAAARLRNAAGRVRARADAFGDRQTAADPPTGERWDRGQVLSHIAEFLPYWIEELKGVVAAGGQGAPFGRTKATPSRLARIEAGRHGSPSDLLREIDAGIQGAIGFMRGLDPAQWEMEGTHPSLGVMSVATAINEFIVTHLEQHADQLEVD